MIGLVVLSLFIIVMILAVKQHRQRRKNYIFWESKYSKTGSDIDYNTPTFEVTKDMNPFFGDGSNVIESDELWK